jgi:hypothetical protein
VSRAATLEPSSCCGTPALLQSGEGAPPTCYGTPVPSGQGAPPSRHGTPATLATPSSSRHSDEMDELMPSPLLCTRALYAALLFMVDDSADALDIPSDIEVDKEEVEEVDSAAGLPGPPLTPRYHCTPPSSPTPTLSTLRWASQLLFMPEETSPTEDTLPALSPMPPAYSQHAFATPTKPPCARLSVRIPSTPHALQIFSPLVSALFSQLDKDMLLDSPDKLSLPPPHDCVKAYPNGDGATFLLSMPGHSGILTSSEPDLLSSNGPDLAVIQSDHQRVAVRLCGDSDLVMAGDVITIAQEGGSASVSGPSACALTVIPARGIAAAIYIRNGEARMSVAHGALFSPTLMGNAPHMPTPALTTIKGQPKPPRLKRCRSLVSLANNTARTQVQASPLSSRMHAGWAKHVPNSGSTVFDKSDQVFLTFGQMDVWERSKQYKL